MLWLVGRVALLVMRLTYVTNLQVMHYMYTPTIVFYTIMLVAEWLRQLTIMHKIVISVQMYVLCCCTGISHSVQTVFRQVHTAQEWSSRVGSFPVAFASEAISKLISGLESQEQSCFDRLHIFNIYCLLSKI